jgi:hypothetical protein
MALRTGHGTGAGQPRIEVLPADELPKGVPGPADPVLPTDHVNGKFAKGNRVSRKGGRVNARRTELAKKLTLETIVSDPAFARYRKAAKQFRVAQCSRLAETVGGGECGPAPSSIIATAALQLAASRFAFDRGEHEIGSKLGNDSRQNLLAAHELCAKEALARPAKPAAVPWFVADGGESKPEKERS